MLRRVTAQARAPGSWHGRLSSSIGSATASGSTRPSLLGRTFSDGTTRTSLEAAAAAEPAVAPAPAPAPGVITAAADEAADAALSTAPAPRRGSFLASLLDRSRSGGGANPLARPGRERGGARRAWSHPLAAPSPSSAAGAFPLPSLTSLTGYRTVIKAFNWDTALDRTGEATSHRPFHWRQARLPIDGTHVSASVEHLEQALHSNLVQHQGPARGRLFDTRNLHQAPHELHVTQIPAQGFCVGEVEVKCGVAAKEDAQGDNTSHTLRGGQAAGFFR